MSTQLASKAADLVQRSVALGLSLGTGFLIVSIGKQAYALRQRRRESEFKVQQLLERGKISQEQIDAAIKSKGKIPIPGMESDNPDKNEIRLFSK